MELQRLARSGRTGYAVPDLPRDLLLRLVECPELPLRMGPAETIKAGNTALVVRASLPLGDRMTDVAWKRVRRKTLLKRFTQAVGPNRTLRTFRAGHRLLAAGVATARPLAVIVPSRFDLAAPSWLATEWLHGAEDLAAAAQRARQSPPLERDACATEAAEAVGTLLGRLHAAGFAHRDLKPQNVMFRRTRGGPEAFLIDLDGVRFAGAISDSARWRNLSRLAVAEHGWRDLAPTAGRRFLESYLAAADVGIDWREAWRRLEAATAVRQARRAA